MGQSPLLSNAEAFRLGIHALRFTSKAEGDLGHAGRISSATHLPADLMIRRHAVHGGQWSWLRQVHSDVVHCVRWPGDRIGLEGDALVTVHPDAVLSIYTADCAPIAIVDRNGPAMAAVHAGWKGLVGGVIERTVEALRELGATDLVAALGPCAHAQHYEFGEVELQLAVDRYGDVVSSTTIEGKPALDVPAGVAKALANMGVPLEYDAGVDTLADDRWYSHRARAEAGRQALVVWNP